MTGTGPRPRHVIARAAQAEYRPVPGATGLARWACVDEQTPGAVHTGFEIWRLDPGGSVPARVQSFEESFYILEGEVVLRTEQGATLLRPGDYGLLPVGTAYSWRNESAGGSAGESAGAPAGGSTGAPARWARMLAPQPRARHGGDALAVPDLPGTPAAAVDVRDPRNRRYGHIEPEHMDPGRQSQQLLAASASMRTALLVYSGITVKMMVDSDLGAQLATMFMVHYDPDGVAGRHDHPFEETYLFLEGEAEAEFDGQTYRLAAGDVAFAGVGCVHGFRNLTGGPLRWLETQAPQPPRRHSYRFARDWDHLTAALDEGDQS